MDAEEIAQLVAGLKVSDEAKEKVVISDKEAEKGRQRADKVVVGKIISKRSLNRETLRSNLPRILRSRGNTEVEVVGFNLFVISFALESDKRTVLDEGPWHFFNDLMILKQTQPMQAPSEVLFDEISLWVQCHNVPFDCMEPSIIQKVGAQVGRVEEIDVREGGSCVGKFARVRVTRRIEDSLIRCVPLVHGKLDKEVLILIQYERLPEFCFACGRIGHILKDCSDASVEKGVLGFGGWLRARRAFSDHRFPKSGAGSTSQDSRGGARSLPLLGTAGGSKVGVPGGDVGVEDSGSESRVGSREMSGQEREDTGGSRKVGEGG